MGVSAYPKLCPCLYGPSNQGSTPNRNARQRCNRRSVALRGGRHPQTALDTRTAGAFAKSLT